MFTYIGINAKEKYDISNDDGLFRLSKLDGDVFRDDEIIEVIPVGGDDTVVVNDTGGTKLLHLTVDLEGTFGGGTGDNGRDLVQAHGTNGDDTISIAGSGGRVTVIGLSADLLIDHAEAKLDRLTILADVGNDVVDASGLNAGNLALQLNGSFGNDVLIGSAGSDLLSGDQGFDVAHMGDGDDVFVWFHNEDSDIVEGEAGFDTLQFTAISADEKFTVSATGGRAQLSRDLGNVTMDLAGVERIELTPDSGFDTVTVEKLTGTDVKQVAIALAGELDGLDGSFDRVFLHDDNNPGQVTLTRTGSTIQVNGLSAAVTISDVDASDELTLFGFGGNDRIDASGLPAGSVKLTLDGGVGNDTLIGGAGGMILRGDFGDDQYFVASATTAVVEFAAHGTADRVFASVSYTLGVGQEIEKLTTADNFGIAAINLTGNGIANIIFGNAGANILDGRAGADTLAGLGGDDFYFVDNAGDFIVEQAGEGSDRVFAGVGYTLTAGAQVEKLTTSDNLGLDSLTLIGNEFGNTIFGNAGSNALKGGLGNDTLVGLGGADAFVFNTALNATTNVDMVADFSRADGDIIMLGRGVFTTLSAGTLSAGAFRLGASAGDADDRIIYDPATGALGYDADGLGGVAAVQFAAVSPGLAFTNADFLVA